jgi:transposase
MDLERKKGRVEPLTITSNGRRYFDAGYKRQVVEQALAPGASVAAVALAHGFNANLVRRWVRAYQAAAAEGTSPRRLIPVSVIEADEQSRLLRGQPTPQRSSKTDGAPTRVAAVGLIELQLGTAIVRVHGLVEEAALRTVLRALGDTR